MSHITTITLEVSDLYAMADAVASLAGLEFRRDQHTFRAYGGRARNCEAAIVMANNSRAYEIGLVRDQSGALTIAYDSWNEGNGMMDVVGENCYRLTQAYGKAVAIKTARREGLNPCGANYLQDGTLELEFEAPMQSADQNAYVSAW